jgi:hypothetical protein
MRTDAQQGIILNIVVGIVGAVIAGLIFGGGNINGGSLDRDNFLWFAARRGHPAGDRQPDPPGHGPLARRIQIRRPRGIAARPFSLSLQLEAHRERDLQLLLAGIDLGVGACAARARIIIGIGGGTGDSRPLSLTDRHAHDAHAQRARVELGARAAVGDRLGRASSSAASGLSMVRLGPLIWLAPSATSASRILPAVAMSRKRTLTGWTPYSR